MGITIPASAIVMFRKARRSGEGESQRASILSLLLLDLYSVFRRMSSGCGSELGVETLLVRRLANQCWVRYVVKVFSTTIDGRNVEPIYSTADLSPSLLT